ncbi:uncharacterized protein V3H82_010374 [Fundulus diaphanus]
MRGLPAGVDDPDILAYVEMCERQMRERYTKMASARDPAPPIRVDSTPHVVQVGIVTATPEPRERSRSASRRLGHHLHDSQLAPRVRLIVPPSRAPRIKESQLWEFYYGDRDDLLPCWPAATPEIAPDSSSVPSRRRQQNHRRGGSVKAQEEDPPPTSASAEACSPAPLSEACSPAPLSEACSPAPLSEACSPALPPSEACCPSLPEVAEEMVPPPPVNSALPTTEGSALPAAKKIDPPADEDEPKASEGAVLPQPEASEGAAFPLSKSREEVQEDLPPPKPREEVQEDLPPPKPPLLRS